MRLSNTGREPKVTNVLTLRQPGFSEDRGLERNPGMAYTPELFNGLRINRSAVERRCATIAKRRSIKKDNQTAWLLKALTCMDLTTLAGDDTPGLRSAGDPRIAGGERCPRRQHNLRERRQPAILRRRF